MKNVYNIKGRFTNILKKEKLYNSNYGQKCDFLQEKKILEQK